MSTLVGMRSPSGAGGVGGAGMGKVGRGSGVGGAGRGRVGTGNVGRCAGGASSFGHGLWCAVRGVGCCGIGDGFSGNLRSESGTKRGLGGVRPPGGNSCGRGSGSKVCSRGGCHGGCSSGLRRGCWVGGLLALSGSSEISTTRRPRPGAPFFVSSSSPAQRPFSKGKLSGAKHSTLPTLSVMS